MFVNIPNGGMVIEQNRLRTAYFNCLTRLSPRANLSPQAQGNSGRSAAEGFYHRTVSKLKAERQVNYFCTLSLS